MRLEELNLDAAKHLARTVWDRTDAVERWLVEHGFTQLGRGSYGSVWTDYSRVVVKVFHNDPAYVKFVEFCRSHRGDPHLPKISKLYPLAGNSGIVFMELLTPYEGDRKFVDTMDDYFHWRMLDFSGRLTTQGIKFPEWMPHFAKKNKNLAGTLDELAYYFCQTSYFADIHSKNIMMRGNTIVITDPVN